ncbi:MAG: hypothetical protein RIR11_3791 [Bacteroidota bacterium]|jgi:hypothetical protein
MLTIQDEKNPSRIQVKTNRLFQVLSTFSVQDRKRLDKFLQSPFFNQSKTLTKLFEVFVDLIEKEKMGFVKEKVWSKIFIGKPYNDTNFRKACSDLMELVEQFMSIESYLLHEENANLDRIDFILKRNIQPLIKGVINDQSKLYQDRNYWRFSDYYYAYSFEKKYHSLMNFDVKTDQNSNLDKISSNLDLFYLTEKLKLLNSALTNNLMNTKGFDMNDVDAILKLCEKYNLDEHPELAINYYTYQTISNGDNVEYYYKLKAVLEKHAIYIPQEESINFFDATLNYSISRLNKGDKSFLQEYFDLFEVGISQGVFIVNGELASRRFNNIVIAGLRLGKMDWAQQFVNENIHLLASDSRNNAYKFNMARVSLYKKDFNNVLNHVRDVEYDDIFVNLISKVMIVIAYYELDEYEALDTFLETYRTFINRQKDLPDGIKNGYINLLGYVRRLMRLKSGDYNAIQKLKEDISNATASTVNQEWLLEKIAEF